MISQETRERALALLVAAVAGAGKGGKAAVAERLGAGCSRSLLARVLSPNDPCVMSDKLALAVIKAYDRRDCPHTGESVEPALCRKKALGPKPFGGSARAAWWLTCQACPFKPALTPIPHPQPLSRGERGETTSGGKS